MHTIFCDTRNIGLRPTAMYELHVSLFTQETKRYIFLIAGSEFCMSDR